MQKDELKQEFTPAEICEACGFGDKTFYRYKKAGKIPEPDDTDRKPFIWYRYKILPFIEEWRKNHPDKIYPPLP